jgi:hypothetical protein
MSDLSNDTKKHTTKSRETIPLRGPDKRFSASGIFHHTTPPGFKFAKKIDYEIANFSHSGVIQNGSAQNVSST